VRKERGGSVRALVVGVKTMPSMGSIVAAPKIGVRHDLRVRTDRWRTVKLLPTRRRCRARSRLQSSLEG